MSRVTSSRVSTDLVPPEVVDAARKVVAVQGTARIRLHDRLKRSVHRLCFEVAGGSSSVVVKRLLPARAETVRLAIERWLPEEGLEGAAPRLRDVVAESGGRAVWHIYEDVPGRPVDSRRPDRRQIGPVVELTAALHAAFSGHPLLAECRALGADLGMAFFCSEVAKSIGHLRSLTFFTSSAHFELRQRLLNRMECLYGERSERGRLLALSEDEDTLLHGDLWNTNTLVTTHGEASVATFVDWDNMGVGPSTYDLSTFLLRFPKQHRAWILAWYSDAAVRRGRRPPDHRMLNQTFETAEFARYACCLTEAAAAAARGDQWGFKRMADIEGWFLDWRPHPLGQSA